VRLPRPGASARAERALWKTMFGDHPFGAWPTVDQIAAHKSGEISDIPAEVK